MLVPELIDLVPETIKDKNEITITNINEEVQIHEVIDIDDPKQRKKMIKTIESLVRRSPEYSAFIGYLKRNLNITKCIFHPDVDINVLKKTKIEFHHYPFTLFDITSVIMDKYIESHGATINPFIIAEEIMKLHYDLKVGLVPLSETVHELAHSGKKFINLKYVTQSYLKFIAEYSKWIPLDLINNWQNLKDLSTKEDKGELKDADILAHVKLELEILNSEEPVPIPKEEPSIA